MKKFKKKYIPIYILLAVFAVYTIIWFVHCIPYIEKKFDLGFHLENRGFVLDENGFMYSVGMPQYLSFTGCLAIDEMEKEQNSSTSMLIWPDREFKNFKVNINISKIEFNEGNWGSLTERKQETCLFLDEDMKPIDRDSEDILSQHPEYLVIIKEMYQRAYDKWGILGEK